MKKILFILALAALLTAPSSAMTVVEKPMGYISVSTSAKASVKPNVANVSFTVETTDVNSQRATDRNAQISTKVLNTLKEQLKNDKKSEIKTKNYSLRPNYTRSDKATEVKILNYTVTNVIEVKTYNTDIIGQLISSAVSNNVTRVSDVIYSTDGSENYAESALNEALTKARNIAQATAARMNQKVVGIKQINVNSYQQNNRGQVYASLKQDMATPPLEKGSVQQNVNIEAEFYVK